MRVSKPVILYLPQSLISELDNYLEEAPPNFKFERKYFYYLIHYLTVMAIQYKNDEYFPMKRDFLKSVTVSNIDRYIKILENGEFIISDKSYKKGMKSLKYKLNLLFIDGLSKFELQPGCKLSNRIVKKLYQGKSHYNRLEPHLRRMKDEFMKIELDYPAAYKWIENNSKGIQWLNYFTSVNHIEDKRFRYFKRNKTNRRLDTNLTNFKSDLRQFIKGNYVSIDLKNSQPFLLGVLIDRIINNRDTLCCYLEDGKLIENFGVKQIKSILLFRQNQEKSNLAKFRTFYNSVSKGVLYEELIKSFPRDNTREVVKRIMFEVLFSRNEYYSRYRKIIPFERNKKAFERVFPFVSQAVRTLKTKDHKVLPIYLQSLESFLFIDCIAKDLVNNGIVPFTIHDSVIVKKEYHKKALEIMEDVFMKQLGVIPSFDVKDLKQVDYPVLKPKQLNSN